MNPIVLRFVPVALLIACASNRPEAVTPNAAVVQPDPVVATSPGAPLRVTLDARDAAGVVHLTATVHIAGRLPAGPTLRVRLPEGAVLVDGLTEEILPLQAAGTTVTRRFGVKDLRGSAAVTADVVTAAMGAHAEATWPEQPKPASQMPELQRITPITIRGVTVDKVVPLSPRPVAEESAK